jgi:hypothetical protein
MTTTLFSLIKRIIRRSTRRTAPAAKASFRPAVEGLEERELMYGVASPLSSFMQGQVRTLQQYGPVATANTFYNAGMQTLPNMMNRGGMGFINGMNSSQALNYVYNTGLDNYIQSEPDGFNPLTLNSGMLHSVYTGVSNNIAQRYGYSPTNKLTVDALGILSDPHYGLTSLPQTAHLGGTQAAIFNLGVAQYGTSYLARRPDGSQALPSDYRTLQYNNSQVFDPTKINYSNPYANPWNG